MHYYIFAAKDTWVSSGSNKVDGETFTDQNFGRDEILELKKVFYNDSFDYPTRVLVSFKGTDFTNLSQSVVEGDITNPKYYLRLYEANGTQELQNEYSLIAHPVSQSWDEGIGKFADDPKVLDGCSWVNRQWPQGGAALTWSKADGSAEDGPSIMTGALLAASQSFSNESPDINMDITDIVDYWYRSGSSANHGLLLKFSGSQETNETGSDVTTGQFKFFSSNTNTIYAPKLEVRWDNHFPCTGSNTGSLLQMTMSGQTDYILNTKGLQKSYKEEDKVKFRVRPRERYVQKTFSRSVQTTSGSYIPESSGSYSIVDLATGETVVPFSAYTSMSCDAESNYFIQWMNGFHPNRAYKVLYKIKFNDGQEKIYDEDFEFIVRS
jgi:hypothetical protein